jgi:hypothetical protein
MFFPDHLAILRNQAFKWFRDECNEPWLLVCDDDVVPVDGVEKLLGAEGDIVCAHVPDRHHHDRHLDTFSLAAAKVHRRVVESLDPPWFRFSLTEDGVGLKESEGAYFARKCSSTGFTVASAGQMGRRLPVTVVPGDTRATFLFDEEL